MFKQYKKIILVCRLYLFFTWKLFIVSSSISSDVCVWQFVRGEFLKAI